MSVESVLLLEERVEVCHLGHEEGLGTDEVSVHDPLLIVDVDGYRLGRGPIELHCRRHHDLSEGMRFASDAKEALLVEIIFYTDVDRRKIEPSHYFKKSML